QGDRSENAEYHAAKEKLRHIDKRLFYLNSMIQKSKIIDPSELDHSRVHFGATIVICDLDSEEEFTYTLCGVLESEPDIGLISVHAPLARAMMGKVVDDEFRISLPSGNKNYEIIEISYAPIFSLKKVIRTEKEFSFR
ncbi:MAG: transcription elongation factor GreA, partial [Campylobacterota bacterium]|nr:transcription elongation factor GreA [Campylobacterota bacterium]